MTHIEFVSSPRPTVGVEMELELINRDTPRAGERRS